MGCKACGKKKKINKVSSNLNKVKTAKVTTYKKRR
mgnify:CR=1 FL=1|tara:strand:- start:82 stop:186 length:105 start_codon:yes stop_codon:yes gene_type:complete